LSWGNGIYTPTIDRVEPASIRQNFSLGSECEYRHIRPVFDTKYFRPYATTGDNFSFSPCPIWAEFVKATGLDCSLVEKTATSRVVRPLRKNVEATIAKCDAPYITPTGVNYTAVLLMVMQYFSYFRSSPDFVGPFDVSTNTSPGFTYLKLGFKTKAEVLEFCKSYFLLLVVSTSHIPILTTNDKREILNKEELAANKIRMTYCTNFDFLMKQKFLFEGQNKLMLENFMNCWIKYGLAKQYGGFHRAIAPLEKFMLRIESDCSGWDRKSPLGDVYKIRRHNLCVPYYLEELYQYVLYFTLNPHVILPNGKVVMLKTGNISGSNNTTTDNSILHFLVLIYLFFKLWVLKFPDYSPTIADIFTRAIFCIYSDDKLGSFDREFFGITIEEFVQFEIDTYAEFGLVIKPGAHIITEGPGLIDPKHSFLGSFCHYDVEAEKYVPYPRFDKICSSLFLEPLEKLKMTDHFERAMTLVVLSYPNPPIFEIGVEYLMWMYDNPANAKYRQKFDRVLNEKNLDLSARKTFDNLYLGFEARGYPLGFEP
jgi:hypothetical protein